MELTIEKIQECKKINEFLDYVCKKYFEVHCDDWKFYGGWQFFDQKHILLHYGYYDYRDQYETGHEFVPIETLIEFSKTLNK